MNGFYSKSKNQNNPKVIQVKLFYKAIPDLETNKLIDSLVSELGVVIKRLKNNSFVYELPAVIVNEKHTEYVAQFELSYSNIKNRSTDRIMGKLKFNELFSEENNLLRSCNYELTISDKLNLVFNCKTRLKLFADFLSIVVEHTKPDLAYTSGAQKLLPGCLINDYTHKSCDHFLNPFVNIRGFNLDSKSKGKPIIDTLGLHILGLPDFQCFVNNHEISEIAYLFWKHAYYLYNNGNIFESEGCLPLFNKSLKWYYKQQFSVYAPRRAVIDIFCL